MKSLSKLIKWSNVTVGSQTIEISLPDAHESVLYGNGNMASGYTGGEPPADAVYRVKKLLADRLIKNAANQAEQILETAKAHAQDQLEEAKRSGFAAGLESGRQEAREESRAVIGEISSLFASLRQKKEDMIKAFEGEIGDLAIQIAKKIIQTEMDAKSETFLKIYSEAVRDIRDEKWIRLSVSDLQAEFAVENAETLKSMVKGLSRIEIVDIAGAPSGTCIIETRRKMLDAGLDTQILRIKEAFEETK